jgi:hypothetical protein
MDVNLAAKLLDVAWTLMKSKGPRKESSPVPPTGGLYGLTETRE